MRRTDQSVIAFTSFPPPMTGQNVMSDQILRWAEEIARVDRVDTSAVEELSGGGAWHAARLVRRWRSLREAVRSDADVLYIVLSSSRAGRLRDLVTLALARGRVRRVVGHVQVGDFTASLARVGSRRASRRLLRQLDALVVLSPGLIPDLGGSLAQVHVIPNTAPDMEVTASELAHKRAVRQEPVALRVAFVANMLDGKGFVPLLEGVANYQAGDPARPVEVDFVGEWSTPGARAVFEQRARALGVRDRVRIHGPVTDREWIRQLYLAADVVALPSRYRHEALPVCLIEALATGTPVIGSDHAAISDVVSSQTGVLLSDERPDTIARALAELADPVVWAERSVAAREAFETRFAPSLVRDAILEAMGLDLP